MHPDHLRQLQQTAVRVHYHGRGGEEMGKGRGCQWDGGEKETGVAWPLSEDARPQAAKGDAVQLAATTPTQM